MMNDWTRTIYLPAHVYYMSIFCSFINWVSFYAFYSSLSLKQAVVCRARREKHNHGALWLIMDLHNSSWISIDDLWISVIELWASIIGFINGYSWFELWSSISFDLWRSITHNSIQGALQFAVMELPTICGDPSSTRWSSIIYIGLLWSSMIEMSTEFHNKLGSSIIMIFVFSGTLCDYGKVKRTKTYRLLNHVVFDCKK